MTTSKLGDLQVHYALMGEIDPHPENANVGNIAAIKESIQHNGFYAPCIVQSSTGYIIAGNHRYLAAKELGFEQIPVVYLDVDDESAKRMMIADNRLTRIGSDDAEQLTALLEELSESDTGLLGTGYTHDEYQKFADSILSIPDDFIPEPDAPKNDSKGGDYVVEPIPAAGGVCAGVMVSRFDHEPLTMEDYNRIRVALGLGRATRGVLATVGIEDWE